ncbi:hypothetical protein AJ80_07931 [Polytolypa hystricis UAMH7299]|uniref:Uncharacterized protein n=1 Tax=Polytolypa hystricis (strain UAMH7299) TaxID=1447883 RepID=A0A2B7XGA6_POLH7|nr:hypothetical protein AJ80_07931 [Polytolypa hystricis UAMH7299]
MSAQTTGAVPNPPQETPSPPATNEDPAPTQPPQPPPPTQPTQPGNPETPSPSAPDESPTPNPPQTADPPDEPTPPPPAQTSSKPEPTKDEPEPPKTTPSQPPPADPTTKTPDETPPDATTIFITSTAPPLPPVVNTSSTSTSSTLTSSTALPTSAPQTGGSSGLSAAGTIAVAVVVPVVSVALIIIALLFWWRKRKAHKLAEEERKQEIEEYRFNPNNDPTLPAVGMTGNYDDNAGMKDSQAGYRGWGTTTSNSRKLSTNLSSGGGMAVSDSTSNPGYPHEMDNGMQHPDDDRRPTSHDSETAAALQPGVAVTNNRDIHRGPSNASSAYSAANRSDLSDDIPLPGPGVHYSDDSAYYNDPSMQQGPYNDASYGVQPVIRDVQARRNTRIETPSVFPQQGNAGISQNF